MGKAKFGVFLPFYAFKDEATPASLFRKLQHVVCECERLGYHSAWLDDHLMFGYMPILECWTTLSALAVSTKRIRLGTMVTSNGFRNPALLAKMAATLDIVSGGRLEFGLGAGIQEDEHAAYGFPFSAARVRVQRLAESLEIIRKLWCDGKATFTGQHYRIEGAVCEPKLIQKPHPPIIVGGSGEKYLLKVTAKYADRFDFGYQPTLDLYRHKLQVLQSHCTSVGRDFSSIEKACWPTGQILVRQNQTALEKSIQQLKPVAQSRVDFERDNFVGTSDAIPSMLQPYLDLGVTQFMLLFMDLPDTTGLRQFAKAVDGAVAFQS
ncbi:MAG: TIGR03560 family F420-dependent LLM class oxidoreductase [Candidatus Bathyarchaeota archaeon]|nr:TIGR03560 family F420-dependent LLM class oxidoreductase [Candidatus Bathyarchaeota archaeon]